MATDPLARAIDIEARRGAPTQQRVPLSRLRSEAKFQRDLKQSRVRQLVAHWDPRALGTIYTSERMPGTHVVIDGQTRIAALREIAGGTDPQVECLVYRGLDSREEAALFVLFSNSVPLEPIALYEAELLAADPDALGICRTVTTFGLRIGNGPQDGCVRAITAVKKIWRLGGEVRLREVLSILIDSYSNRESRAFRGAMLSGLDLFLERYAGEFNRQRLVDVLKRTDVDVIHRRVDALRAPTLTLSTPATCGMVLSELYSRGLKQPLPRWDDPALVARLKGRGRRHS